MDQVLQPVKSISSEFESVDVIGIFFIEVSLLGGKLTLRNYQNSPFEYPDSRSRIWFVGPHISTADILTENLAPVFNFCSLIPLNSHEIALGIIPSVLALSGVPNIV